MPVNVLTAIYCPLLVRTSTLTVTRLDDKIPQT